ncbi:unnamed protein product [Microthlaspi erraticum]|uniref:SWIM-type domain-containing protein n=1 Tax=Microthlaspi erraticum TaxID=1685480 RepID=A0A6D2JB22_9BRAS|nr:unnamed protein product [Microthlaspi erraticum]
MNDDEDGGAVNTPLLPSQLPDIDKVYLLVGTWNREDNGMWIFETDPSCGEKSINLQSGLSFAVLINIVRGTLHLLSRHITVKLAYQYPEWMAIDDGDGSTPQYITDDQEVEVFVQMRRHIEEVNLCVTVKRVDGEMTGDNTSPICTQLPPTVTDSDVRIVPAATEEDDTEDDWHVFAISETPLTRPNTAVNPSKGGDQVVPNIGGGKRVPQGKRLRTNGITIREGGDTIRLRSPICDPRDKGKAVAEDVGSDTDTSDDDAIVPDLKRMKGRSPVITRNGEVVRRQLFPQTEVHTGENSSEAHSAAQYSDNGDGDGGDMEQSTWGRFDEALHLLLTDLSPDPAMFGRDAPPVFEVWEDDPIESALADVSYEGDKIFVGKVFKSITDCKLKLAIHAINRKFHFRTSRSSPSFMVMKCSCPTCEWRIYSLLMDGSGNFQIRQATLTHTCTVDDRRNYHKLATTQVIGEIMQSKFVGIKKGPNPSGVRKILLDDYHVNVSYWKAWRARELAMDNAMGSRAGSYALLPAYLSQLQRANPGSICVLEHVAEPGGGSRFKYTFIAYGASIAGYPFMRKVIVVDGTSLKGKFGGCLLSACAQDANFQIFPLAFAVVDSENDSSWEWYLRKLSAFIGDSVDLVFISDRHASILSAISKVFPLANHGACTVHLWRNVKSHFKSKRLANLMSAAARAFTVSEFNKAFLHIQRLNPGCAAYLLDIGFQHWTRVHFPGKRFNIMDSNIAESWNAVLKEAREFPLICMLEYIRTSVMNWFAIRRAKSNLHQGTLTPNVRKIIEKTFEDSTSLAVRPICPMEFQVQEPDGDCFTVKILDGTCTCMQFQQLGLPCAHAIAAAATINLPTDSMVSWVFYGESWTRGFDGKIYPVPSVGSMEIGDEISGELMPPAVRRPPGRPKKLRILSRGEFKQQTEADDAHAVVVEDITKPPAGLQYDGRCSDRGVWKVLLGTSFFGNRLNNGFHIEG